MELEPKPKAGGKIRSAISSLVVSPRLWWCHLLPGGATTSPMVPPPLQRCHHLPRGATHYDLQLPLPRGVPASPNHLSRLSGTWWRRRYGALGSAAAHSTPPTLLLSCFARCRAPLPRHGQRRYLTEQPGRLLSRHGGRGAAAGAGGEPHRPPLLHAELLLHLLSAAEPHDGRPARGVL